jgi:putative transposase
MPFRSQKLMTAYREYYHRNLPHWQPEGATLFVTARLAGSLPREIVIALKAERQLELQELAKSKNQNEREQQSYSHESEYFDRWDSALACSASSPTWLKTPEIAEIVAEALRYRDGKIYNLHAYCIMPNHLHMVMTPLQQENNTYFPLHRIMQSFKRHTARRSNQILGRKGAFWQAESYDHVVRDAKELERIIEYVIQNPVKARLVNTWKDWPWTYRRADWQSALHS